MSSDRPSPLSFTLLEMYPLAEAFRKLSDANTPSVGLLEDFCRPLRLSRSRLESKNDRTPGRFCDAAEWMIALAREALQVGESIEPSGAAERSTLRDVRASISGHITALTKFLPGRSEAA